MFLIYVDESYDDTHYGYSAIFIDAFKWNFHFSHLLNWRGDLYNFIVERFDHISIPKQVNIVGAYVSLTIGSVQQSPSSITSVYSCIFI